MAQFTRCPPSPPVYVLRLASKRAYFSFVGAAYYADISASHRPKSFALIFCFGRRILAGLALIYLIYIKIYTCLL